MGRSLIATIVAGCLLATASFAANIAAPETWEFRDGRWQKTEAASEAARIPADPALDDIERRISSGQYDSARKSLIRWFTANKGSPQFDRALYLMSEALYGTGNRIKAFYYCDQLMDEYPDSDYFYKALEKQYQIADVYLSGYKRPFLFMPLLGAEDEAIEMLFRIQQRSPGSPLAEKSLLRTADYYYKEKDYDIAADVYGAYMKSYARSPNIPDVRLRRAYANLAQFRGEKFDPTPVLDARQQLSEMIVDYPELAQQENLSQLVTRIDNTLAKKMDYTAEFYQRTSKPRAASYLYRDMLNRYPDAPAAQEARKAVERLPEPEVMPAGPQSQPLSNAN